MRIIISSPNLFLDFSRTNRILIFGDTLCNNSVVDVVILVTGWSLLENCISGGGEGFVANRNSRLKIINVVVVNFNPTGHGPFSLLHLTVLGYM